MLAGKSARRITTYLLSQDILGVLVSAYVPTLDILLKLLHTSLLAC
jgi:hypothetical protein